MWRVDVDSVSVGWSINATQIHPKVAFATHGGRRDYLLNAKYRLLTVSTSKWPTRK